MNPRYQFEESISVLKQHKLRSFLTIFGIMWGIAAFLFADAVLEGFQSAQRRRFEAVGKDLLIVAGGRTSRPGFGFIAGRSIHLDVDDVHAIAAQNHNIESISPERVRPDVSVSGSNGYTTTSVHGVWPVYQRIRFIESSVGRLLNHADEEHARRVCVIGHDVSLLLFGHKPSLPASIRIDQIRYSVVGVARKKPLGAVLNGSDDAKVFIPVSSMARDFPRQSEEGGSGAALVIHARSSRVHDQLSVEVRRLLAIRHSFHPDDVDALNLVDTALTARNIENVFAGLARFSSISSLMTVAMAAIGLANILLISVRERTREIGVRRSIGARRHQIFIQFLSEGMILSSIGGVFGLLAGLGLALLVGLLPIPGFSSPVPRLGTAITACLVILSTGLVASSYPAWRAVRIDPSEALRHG